MSNRLPTDAAEPDGSENIHATKIRLILWKLLTKTYFAGLRPGSAGLVSGTAPALGGHRLRPATLTPPTCHDVTGYDVTGQDGRERVSHCRAAGRGGSCSDS